MTRIIYMLTLRQLAGQRRTLLMLLFAALPILVAILYRASSNDDFPVRFAANGLGNGMVIAIVLPLTSLIFGTAALGAEIEDGTAVYLLAKPIARWQIVVPKLLAAWTASGLLVIGAMGIGGAITLIGEDGQGVLPAFVIASVLGAFVYSALFLMLSVLTSRALIIGLVYVFLWEAVITGLFEGTRLLSVRHATLGIADALSDTSRRTFEASLGGATSLGILVILSVFALFFAIRRLRAFEIGEST